MARTVGIGIQNFETIILKNCFYIDKTAFIKEWWESNDSVTLITRPRRFGKTLTMSMVESFFSVDYASTKDKIYQLIVDLYTKHSYLKTSDILNERDIEYFDDISKTMSESTATLAFYKMSDFLSRYYNKKS